MLPRAGYHGRSASSIHCDLVIFCGRHVEAILEEALSRRIIEILHDETFAAQAWLEIVAILVLAD